MLKESTARVKPDYLYAWIKDSHPNLHERIENIDQNLNDQERKERGQIRVRRRILPRVVRHNIIAHNADQGEEESDDYY